MTERIIGYAFIERVGKFLFNAFLLFLGEGFPFGFPSFLHFLTQFPNLIVILLSERSVNFHAVNVAFAVLNLEISHTEIIMLQK